LSIFLYLLSFKALEQSGSERHAQYSELKKREAVMEEFLSTFDSAMSDEKNRRSQLESEVVEALAKCSSLLVQTQQLPRYNSVII
jgi:hypothetical protein